ncbi:unnamed protein product [Paramecium pentaurelia]|uniref:Uncharacterized protein n=1 Tax=Paramecium pentaurelia TaxID=43138 RepID=A0A8S1TKA8_9CILI|nr:unnamed protein product [Paramecium pentaurelia]
MIFIFLLILYPLKAQYSLKNKALNQSALIMKTIVEQTDIDESDQNCLTFGIWSKYSPLGNATLKNAYGIFDSNCFQLINSVDNETQSLNFIYYDCLDDTTKEIKKFIQIGFSQTEQFIFSKQIEPSQYDDIWFFFQIISYISKKKVELAIYSQLNQILKETIELAMPNRDQKLILTFGGSLKVDNSNIPQIEQGRIFSIYPGQIIVYNNEMKRISIDFDYWSKITQYFQRIETCQCDWDKKNINQDSHLISLDQLTNVSMKINCNTYTIAGWLQISNIYQTSEEFTYQFMKISTILDGLQNENLATFQLFYHISPIQNKIIITTYKYDFPSVTQDFSNNPFLIRRELPIYNSITSWQYILINLQESVLEFSIIFYEGQYTQSYETTIDIKQFDNYQLKITYGNIQQSNLNYIDVIVRNLLFNNCMQDLKQYKCHYSCQECDGPNKYDCLNCSEESNRIYIPEYKKCVCPKDSIDEYQQCINFRDQNLQLNVRQRKKTKCKFGYFEIDGECIKCPSMIYNNLVTCFECYFLLSTWQEYPYCDIIQELTTISTNEKFPGMRNFFFFDGSDLISAYDPMEWQNSIQDEYGLYEQFKLHIKSFQSFCNSAELTTYDESSCYPCRHIECEVCGVTIDNNFICLQCKYKYVLFNGTCIYKVQDFNYSQCQPPYYPSFAKKCSLCTIENCLYCFEYQVDYEFVINLNQQYILYQVYNPKIGCMLCEKDFNFDFNLGICVKKASKIENCITSYTNVTNEEICLTSSLDNFKISTEITLCNQYILYCSLCFLDRKQQIKCITCESGYILQDGSCYESQEQNPNYLNQYWNLKIESFLISIFNYEQNNDNTNNLTPCGYYCQSCKYSLGEHSCFKCQIPSISFQVNTPNQMCQICSPLCQVCIKRDEIPTLIMAPLLDIANINPIYTAECIIPYMDPNIDYDPYSKMVQYCLQGDCDNELTYEFIEYSCFFNRFPRNLNYQGINTEYLNSIGAVSMTIIIRIEIEDESCILFPSIVTQASLKFHVFTLQTINLKLLTTYPFYLYIFNSLFFEEYDSFTMIDYGIVFPNFEQFDLNISNSYNQVNITLINITLKDSSIKNIQSLFKTSKFGYIDLQNVSIINSQFINSSLFNFKISSLMGDIKINQLYIQNCTFINSILFEFSYVLNPIQFINLTIDQCQLQNSSIFYFRANNPLDIKIFILSASIFRNNFIRSYFFYCSQQVDVISSNLILDNNQLLDSIIFGFSSGLQSSNIEISNNIFIESSFMSTIQMTNQQFASCTMINFIIRNNKLQSSNLFKFFSQFQSSDLFVKINDVIIEFNDGFIINNVDQISYIFNINAKIIILNKFLINSNKKIHTLYLYDINDIQLENFNFENSEIEEKISVKTDCLKNLNFQNQIFQIVGFNKVSISYFKIKQIQSIDESIIKIMSSSQYYQDQVGQIKIFNLEFYGNLLQSLNSINYFSLITIISDKTLDIVIKNLVYQNNIMHVYYENSLKDSAALLYISTLASTINIENLQCKQNAMTNSSNSFIYIATKSLIINNLYVKYHNILPINIWNYYYNLIPMNQEQIQSLIMQIFQIKTIGGAAYIQSSNFSCINSTFEEIMAVKSSVFDIVTSSDGIIMIQNLSVYKTRTNFQERIENTGCLSINAQNSLLNLTIQNAKFQNILNRMSSSILTINPSLLQNKMIFQNMLIIDCVSLKNQIVKIQFISQINKQNQIVFINLIVYQNQESWINLFQYIGELSDSEILEITGNDNTMIYLENCDLSIEDFYIEGMLFSSVFQLNNINTLKFFNCTFQNILNIYTQNLIEITQTSQQKYFVFLNSLNFQNGSMYLVNNQLNYEYQQHQTNYFISGCFIMSFSVEFIQKNYFYSNLIKLLQQKQKQTSIVYIRSESNLTVLVFDTIMFQNNNYSIIQQGIIHFDEIYFKIFRISKFDCNLNYIKKFGCLNIVGNQNASHLIHIKNSNFIQNIGTQGVAIKCSDVHLKLNQCKIISNFAFTQGGGMYLLLNTKQLFIQNTIIIENQAQEGGGIYFEQDNDISIKSITSTFILFNKAQVYGNNLVENPNYLQLFINSKAMPAVDLKMNNISTSILKITPYKVIEQGISKLTDILMIPSTQVIDTYQLFVLQKAAYLPYIKSLNIFFKNSKGELLYNIYNSTCEVSDFIVTNDNQEKQGYIKNSVLLYQTMYNNFELNTLSFRLDPYQQNYNHLSIQIFCKTQKSQQGLKYIINAKSFKCQLGEFYIESGCQICKSSQGFYSVTYDAIKCSVFDKTKFQNITSNMIDLKQGYWRPDYLSDFTEECYKNTEFCLGGWRVGDDTCKMGHVGALCEMCDVYNIRGEGQFFKNQQNQLCVSCSSEERHYYLQHYR